MDEKAIRSFLIASPRGTKILIRTVDDDVHELSPPDGKGRTWSHVAESVMALSPQLIEVHDAEGKLIRATRCTEDVTPNAEVGLPVLHTDPETARLTHFANLLYRATEFSTTLAFTKMVELFALSTERASAIEQRLERTEANYRKEMQDRLDEAFERADELREQAEKQVAEGAPGDPLTEFAKGFLQARNQPTPPAQPAPNGKAVK